MSKTFLRSYLKYFLLISILVYLLLNVSFSKILNEMIKIDFFYLVIAYVLSILGILISSLRLQSLISQNLSYKNFFVFHLINVDSQIYNYITIPFIGSVLARSLYFKKIYNKADSIPLLSLLEKICALLSLFLLAGLSLFFLKTINFSISDLNYLFIIFVIIIFSVLTSWHFSFPKIFKRIFKKSIFSLLRINFFNQFFLSIFIHLCTLFTFILLTNGHHVSISLLDLIFIFSLVMLISALPISYAGWGVRELSLMILLEPYLIDSSKAISIGLLFGFLSILSLVNIKIINHFIKPKENNHKIKENDTINFFKFQKVLILVSSFLIIILINIKFEIKIFQMKGGINLSDPISIISAITFIVIIFKKKLSYTLKNFIGLWDDKYIGIGILIFPFLILYGLIVGYLNFNSNSWALFNRFLGLPIILSYLLTGAFFSIYFSSKILDKYIHSFIITNFVILTFYAFLYNYYDFDPFFMSANEFKNTIFNKLGWQISHYNSLLLNRNNFCFTIICLTIFFNFFHSCDVKIKHFYRIFVFFIIFISGSKTGIFVYSILVFFAYMKDFIYFKKIKINLKIISIYLFMLFVIIFIFFQTSFVNHYIENINFINTFLFRYDQYQLVINEIFKNFLFGSGLGWSIHTSENYFGQKLVIHNSLLWIVCEMGLFGFMFICIMMFGFFKSIYLNYRYKYYNKLFISICFLTTILLFSILHDISYHRVLWLGIGLIFLNKIDKRIRK